MRMKEHSTRKIYNVQSLFYDELVGNLVRRRQRNAIGRMELKPGDKVLDIGIGTGMSLEMYPRSVSVTGIDISEGMLSRAQDKIKQDNYTNASLAIADAMFLPFKDDSFDHIVISLVVTVVSDAVKLLDNIKRVGKPGCRIVIINHFQSGFRLMGWIEKVLNPFCVKVGWRSDLNLHELLHDTNLEVDFRYKVRNIDFWDIIFLRNNKPRLVSYDSLMKGFWKSSAKPTTPPSASKEMQQVVSG